MKKQSPIVKKSKHKSTAHSQRLVLESRLVFDGAIAATAVEVQPEVIDNKPIAEPTSEATPPPSEPTIDIAALEKPATAVDYQPNPDNTEHQPAFSPLATEHPFAATDLALSPVIGVGGEHATTLIIVDPRAENAANLLANPPGQTQVISLDATRDGFVPCNVSLLLQDIEIVVDYRGGRNAHRLSNLADGGRIFRFARKIANEIKDGLLAIG